MIFDPQDSSLTARQKAMLTMKYHEEGGYLISYNCHSYDIRVGQDLIKDVSDPYWHDPLTMLERARAWCGLSVIKENHEQNSQT